MRVFSTMSRRCGMEVAAYLGIEIVRLYAIVAVDRNVRIWAAYVCCP